MDQQVQWLLTEKLLRVRSGEVRTSDDVIARRTRTLAAFASTLEALRYVQAISNEESAEWDSKMWRAIGLEPPADSEPGTISMAYLGDGQPTRPGGSSLVPQYPRSIVGPRQVISVFGGCFGVEDVTYDDSVTLVRWRIGPIPDTDAAFPEIAAALADDLVGMDEWAKEHFKDMNRTALFRSRVARCALEDNVGTEYSTHPINWHSDTEVTGLTAFTPGTPSHADFLSLGWLGSTIRIDL